MGDLALSALLDDEETKVIVLVAKPPSPRVAGSLLDPVGEARGGLFVGLPENSPAPGGVRLAGSRRSGRRGGTLARRRSAVGHGLMAAAAAAAAEPTPGRRGPGTVFRRDALL